MKAYTESFLHTLATVLKISNAEAKKKKKLSPEDSSYHQHVLQKMKQQEYNQMRMTEVGKVI